MRAMVATLFLRNPCFGEFVTVLEGGHEMDRTYSSRSKEDVKDVRISELSMRRSSNRRPPIVTKKTVDR